VKYNAKELKEFHDVLQGLNSPANEFETLLTVEDLQRIFKMKYHAVLKFIKSVLVPMNAAKKVREKWRIHPWGLRRILNLTGRCHGCGRRWTIERDLEYLRKCGMQPDPIAYETALDDPNLQRYYPELPPDSKVSIPDGGPRSKRAMREYEQALKKLSKKKPPTPPVNPDRFKKK